MKKKPSPGKGFHCPQYVEIEIPVLFVKLACDMPSREQIVLGQTELSYAMKIEKDDDNVKFIFEGDGKAGPSVRMEKGRWECKVSYNGNVHSFRYLLPNHGKRDDFLEPESAEKDSTVHVASVVDTEEESFVEKRDDFPDNIPKLEVQEEACYPKHRAPIPAKSCRKTSEAATDSDSKNDFQTTDLDPDGDNETKMEGRFNAKNVSDDNLTERCNALGKLKSKSAKTKTQTSKVQQPAAIKLVCPGCRKFFDGTNKLLYHVRNAHKDQPDYKELKKKLEDLMYKNSSRSQSLLVQQCSVCGRERRGITLLNHLAVWHADCDNYQELVEEAKTQYRKNKLSVKLKREKYLFNQQTNVCPYCSKELAHRASYRKHVLYTCEQNPSRLQLFNCTTCGYSSPNAEVFKRHQEQHGAGVKFVCDLCSKEYRNRSGLVVHQRDVHQLVKKMPIQYHVCHLCQQKFYCKNHYERHVRTHNDDRPMQCDSCGKQFKHADHLNRHRREIHLNQYRYRCEKCGHGVAKLSYLKTHVCGRVRRAQTAQTSPKEPKRKQTTTPEQTDPLNETQLDSKPEDYNQNFTTTNDTSLEGFVIGVLDPVSSLNLYPNVSDSMVPLTWIQSTSSGQLTDNSSSNALINSLLSNS